MLELSRTVVQGAMLRDESRGAHYKPDFPERNDEKFLKTTKASFTGAWKGRSSNLKRWTRSTSSRGRDVTTRRSNFVSGRDFRRAAWAESRMGLLALRDHGEQDSHF